MKSVFILQVNFLWDCNEVNAIFLLENFSLSKLKKSYLLYS